MAKSVRIWQKGSLRLNTLTVKQNDMVTIATYGLASVLRRLSQSQGPTDAPAKPLKRRYALYKMHSRKNPLRNLVLSGQLLAGMKVRTVSDDRAYIAPDSRIRTEFRKGGKKFTKDKGKRLTNKQVAEFNEKRESWLAWSPINRRVVWETAYRVLIQMKNKLIVKK